MAAAGIVVAVGAATAAILLAVASGSSGNGAPTVLATPSGGGPAEQVSESDFCFVESMIFYRVEATGIGGVILDTEGISPEARAVAADLVAEQEDELVELRERYVAWSDARPLERPEGGPCAGHGAHADMPGVPTWGERSDLADATGAEAETLYVTLMRAHIAGVIDLAATTLQGDPNSVVRATAENAISQGERDAAAMAALPGAGP